VGEHETSRFSREMLRVHAGVSDRARAHQRLALAPLVVWPAANRMASAPSDVPYFAVPYPAYARPCQRFDHALANMPA